MSRARTRTTDLETTDRALVREFDARVRAAARLAGGHLTCHRGCTPCCIGVFDITALDAARLRRGMAELEARRPRVAREVRDRATAQWEAQRSEFPGDTGLRELGSDQAARERFFSCLGHLACPALRPRDGSCRLYRWRPLSCRSYGLPLTGPDGVLPPCPLNFRTARPAEVAAAAVDPDPGDRESELLALVVGGDTTIAAALAPDGLPCARER